MKTSLSALLAVLLLSGCGTTITRKEPYPVYVTIPIVQKAPNVDRCELMVDKLADKADPGTIAQAYKHDTECLRSKIVQYEAIIAQYNSTADAADQSAQQLKDQFSKIVEQYKQDISAIEASRKP